MGQELRSAGRCQTGFFYGQCSVGSCGVDCTDASSWSGSQVELACTLPSQAVLQTTQVHLATADSTGTCLAQQPVDRFSIQQAWCGQQQRSCAGMLLRNVQQARFLSRR